MMCVPSQVPSAIGKGLLSVLFTAIPLMPPNIARHIGAQATLTE